MCAIANELITCFQQAVGATQGEFDRKLQEGYCRWE